MSVCVCVSVLTRAGRKIFTLGACLCQAPAAVRIQLALALGHAIQPQKSPPLHNRRLACKSILLFIEAYFVAHTLVFTQPDLLPLLPTRHTNLTSRLLLFAQKIRLAHKSMLRQKLQQPPTHAS